ncbi:MAG: ATP-binding protein [Myxococcaceae bacterium]
MPWGFYGRKVELQRLEDILGRKRWFFVKVTGRRRIGKTTLIQQALQATGNLKIFYVQIPDSGPAGVISSVIDAMDTFQIAAGQFPRPRSLSEFAKTIAALAQAGYVVALDEFQYFNRDRLGDFPSLLQREVDALSARASTVPGGLLVLGSIHTDIQALLENQSAPLFNRTTDDLELTHLDLAALLELLRTHADPSPARLLFLWTLFEGVPKFYRDCFEQGVLGATREELLRRIFFESSSPLRTEADNWFLHELRGRYDVVLKYVARNEGCTNGEITDHVRQLSLDTDEQVAGYLKILIERYRLIEKKRPVFAKPKARGGRYYVADNFLAAWLAALANPVSAVAFSPVEKLVHDASTRLYEVEGYAFEKLVATLYEERSRKGLGDFSLSSRITGYWNSADTEIDLVAIDRPGKRIRLGGCKRSEERLVGDITNFDGHVARFLKAFPEYGAWRVEKVALAPAMGAAVRKSLEAAGYLAQDLGDLTAGLV